MNSNNGFNYVVTGNIGSSNNNRGFFSRIFSGNFIPWFLSITLFLALIFFIGAAVVFLVLYLNLLSAGSQDPMPVMDPPAYIQEYDIQTQAAVVDQSPYISELEQRIIALEQLLRTNTLVVTGDDKLESLIPENNDDVSVQIQKGGLEVADGKIVASKEIVTFTSFYQSSDERIKENITDRVYNDSIQSINGLRVTEFDYIERFVNQTGRQHIHDIGFIAQEFAQVYPESVSIVPSKVVKDLNVIDTKVVIADLVKVVQYLLSKQK